MYLCGVHGWFTVEKNEARDFWPCTVCTAPSERGWPIGTKLMVITDEVPGGKVHPSVGYFESKSELARKTRSQGKYDRREFGDYGGRDGFEKYCRDRKKERYEQGLKKINDGIEKVIHEMPEAEVKRQVENQLKVTPDTALVPKGAM